MSSSSRNSRSRFSVSTREKHNQTMVDNNTLDMIEDDLSFERHDLMKAVKKIPGGEDFVLLKSGKLGIPFNFNTGFGLDINLNVFFDFPDMVEDALKEGKLRGKERKDIARILVESFSEDQKNYNKILYDFSSVWKNKVSSILDTHGIDSDFENFINSKIWPINNEYVNSDNFLNFLEVKFDKILIDATNSFLRGKSKERLKEEVGITNYPSLFPLARKINRKLTLLLGPTNSGKTYEALNRLASANTGAYLAPLRLMALEGVEKLAERLTLSNLVTGEEIEEIEGAKHTSSTIEMLNLNKELDAVVIDEIQLISDRDRGWAWTQAVIGAPAKEIIMTGSPDALPIIVKIAEMLNEPLEIKYFERKTSLEVLDAPVSLSALKKGDAVVAFSRKEVMHYREEIKRKGFSVASIYGALGPEVRKSEAKRFREGDADILIATDAIGMGLNLPIQRVIFSSLQKYDGSEIRELNFSEIRQIAGRAGRFGFSEKGYVGVLGGMDSRLVSSALESLTVGVDDLRPFVMPSWNMVDILSEKLSTKNLSSILEFACQKLISDTEIWRSADIYNSVIISKLIEKSGLDLKTSYQYLGCPVNIRDESLLIELKSWALSHGQNTRVLSPDFSSFKTNDFLFSLERYGLILNMYLWLSLRWPDIYTDIEMAKKLKAQNSNDIENCLSSSFN